MTTGLRVAIAGCGRIGRVRAAALRPIDEIVGCFDVVPEAARALALDHGARAAASLDELLELEPDVVVVATWHDQLAPTALKSLAAGAHVLLEKPAGLGTGEVGRLIDAAAQADRLVKVGFNHRFHPALRRAHEEISSGQHGELMHIRGRYGHGGRLGYDREWRSTPELSGGGELVDQGMHLIDLVHWMAGPLPLHSALLRTQFWETDVEDNAALILGEGSSRTGPWAMLHVSWTEWKNTFSFEIYCRTAKLQIDGLVRSYGAQTLRIYRMGPELVPPELEEVGYPDVDDSWAAEWANLASGIDTGGGLLGTLDDAHYAWEQIERAYRGSSYASVRAVLAR